MKIKRAIDFIKRNAKILLLIYIAVIISVVAVQQIRISRQKDILLRGQVILSNEQDKQAELINSLHATVIRMLKDEKGFAEVIRFLARKTALTFATVSEMYFNTEKNISRRGEFIKELEALDKKFEKALSTKSEDLTEAQKMGKKLGKDTVEAMKAMEEELHKAGYPH